MFHGPEVVVNKVLVAVFFLGGTPALGSEEATFGAAAAIQHRRVAELAGDQLDYRAGGPAVVLTAKSAGPSATLARVEWASTLQSNGAKSWTGRLEAERRQSWGSFYAGSRVALGGEGVRDDPEAGLIYAEASWAPVAGLKLQAGPARLRVTVGVPAVGGMVRPGCTMLAPDLLDATPSLAEKARIPAAIHVTGPWNHPAIDFTGRARWQLEHGEAWVAVRTTVERADVGHLERKMTTVQPEVGWSWGGRGGESADKSEVMVPQIDVLAPTAVVPAVEVVVPPVVPPVDETPAEEPASDEMPPADTGASEDPVP